MKHINNKKKDEQLGMPYGTACYKLRKSILFQLVQETGKDVCYHCNEYIKTVDDFSIEHKKPWIDINTKLFWDLNNIAFSHTSCNYANKRHYTPSNIEGHKKQAVLLTKARRDGYSWCKTCKQELTIDNFHKNKSQKLGIIYECKMCRNAKRRKKSSCSSMVEQSVDNR